MTDNITKKIYDEHASSWERKEPNSLSDFTGRPAVFDLCGDVTDLNILDIGCGEGYCARVLNAMDAKFIEGIDISPEMIERAKQQGAKNPEGINYQTGDVQELSFKDESFDLVLGMFVYNYLTIEETERSFKEVFRVLKKGGSFVFAVPHPALPQIKKELTAPFYFDFKNAGYFTSRNQRHHGEIFCRDGKQLPVQMVHKLFEDYMNGLASSGFTTIPTVRELGVLDSHIDLDKDFFTPVYDIPLHLAFRICKN
jgi:ubiquinone/menaquinone biosynthesis C-methylase UbiE